jgi:hypothetical protein
MDEMMTPRSRLNEDVLRIIDRLSGEPCSRKEVGRMKSLSLGFGDEVAKDKKFPQRVYRSWELGTYRGAWRVTQRGIVLCGSQDTSTRDEMNIALQNIAFGNFVSLQQLTDLDIRIELSDGISVEFFATMSDDDECFHIFCPDNVYIEFSVRNRWTVGCSDKPSNEVQGTDSQS